ncbi:MAG: fibronectin type III domain-containing protein [Chitinophagaceae bacterium]|nr:fibronectin type III domain-containing protein [Chitinophagaceae bacterium]
MNKRIQHRRGGFTRFIKPILFSFILLFGLQFTSQASHFRYHSVSWSMGTNDTVIFQMTQSWRWSAFGNPAMGSVVPISSITFGDGSFSSFSILITSINPSEDWFTGVTTLKHKYPANGTYIFQYSDCCRIGGLLDGNSGLSEIMRTSVTVGGNPQNNSPVSNVPAIVNMQLNTPNTFAIPGFDPDGDALTFSITPTSESALNTSTPPGLTLSPAGVINWTPTVAGLSAFSVKITDSKGDFTTVDFLLRSSTLTSNPPTYDYSVTPVNNFVYSVNPGTPINFNVKADDVDAGSQVVLSASGVPSGAVFTPSLPTSPANPATTSFSWTPTLSDFGSYVIAFTATDNNSQQAITNVVINVNTNPVFNYPPTPPNGTGFCLMTGVPFSQLVEASNLLSAVDVSITSMTGLPPTATTSPSLPTTPASIAQTTLNWTPSPSEWGPHTVTFNCIDANSKTASTSFNLLVNSSPYFTSAAAPNSANIGVTYSHLFTADDPNLPYGDDLEFVAIGLPSWLTFTDNGNGTATLTGTPSALDAGTYTFDIHLEDFYHHCGPSVEETVTITVQSNCNTTGTDNVTNCGSYTWANGTTYTQSGTYTHVFTTQSNCDSTVTLNLTINSLPNVSVSDIYSCPGVPIQLNGMPAGGFWNISNPYFGNSMPFTYYFTDANGCTGSATGNIVVGQPQIVNVSVTNITGISASVTYQGVNGIGWYDLRWRPVGSSTWTTGTNYNFTTKLLTNLIPNTNYEVQVRGFCTVTSPAGPWTTTTFSTNNLCSVPTGLFANNVAGNSAKLNWTAVPGVAFYTVRWKAVSASTWSSATSTIPSKVVTGLTTNTNYEFQVRSHCGSSAGAYSASSTFTTASSKTNASSVVYNEVGGMDLKVYPNPTSGEFTIEFKADRDGEATIKVLDLSGRVVKQIQTVVTDDVNVVSLNISELTSGMYQIQVENEGSLKTVSKILKN